MPFPFITPRNQIPISPLPVEGVDPNLSHILSFSVGYETKGDLATGAPHEVEGDAGGFTKFGVAQNFNPEVNVKDLKLQDAAGIYQKKYWEGLQIPRIRDPLAQGAFFDYAMNSTPGAIQSAQSLTGATVDGKMGPQTIGAINEFVRRNGPEAFVQQLNESRRQRILEKSPKKFQKGLLARVDDLEAFLVANPSPARGLANMPDNALADAILDSPMGTFGNRDIEELTYGARVPIGDYGPGRGGGGGPGTPAASGGIVRGTGGQRPIERRAAEREADAQRQREAEGAIATGAYEGRTAEVPGAEGGRVDYSPQERAPIERPPTLELGTAAQHDPRQIGPVEQFLFGGPEQAAEAKPQAKPLSKMADWRRVAAEDPAIRAWFKQLTGASAFSAQDILSNMANPESFYDYEAAIRAGHRPVLGPDGQYHWPSLFKKKGHPTYHLKYR